MRLVPRCVFAIVASGLLVLSQAAVAQQSTVSVATWNMSWLTNRLPGTGGEGGVPANVHHRTRADWALVKKYARRLNADIVAFEEVDGVALAKKAFGSRRYKFHSTTEPDVQKPGFAIRKGIQFTRNPDYADLDIIADRPRSLRRGADITIRLGGQNVRMLAVHLKSACPERPLNAPEEACTLLQRQLPILSRWVADRIREGVPFLILGDFNRVFADNEEFWRALNLDGAAGLVRSTDGRVSPCWGGEHPKFIDHIVFGGPARQWPQPASFKVLVYDETDRSFEKKISDHCPQSIDVRAR